jgi:hypothetical protein
VLEARSENERVSVNVQTFVNIVGKVVLDQLQSLVRLDCKNSFLKKIKNGMASNLEATDCIQT